MRRTLEQNRRLWRAVGEVAKVLGDWETAEEIMRDAVEDLTGQRSTKVLTVEQCEKVIAWLEGRKERYGRFTGEMTGGQRMMIQELEKKLGWHRNVVRLERFAMRVIGKVWPESSGEAWKLIEGLKAMYLRSWTMERFERYIAGIDEERLTEWEKKFLEDVRGQIERNGHPVRIGVVRKLEEIWRRRRKGVGQKKEKEGKDNGKL